MADESQAKVDRKIRRVENRINEIYGQARLDIENKIDEFNRGFEARNSIHLQELANGTITQSQYDAWLRGQVFQSEQWAAKRDQICGILDTANQQATAIVNGGTIGAFAEGANWTAYSLEHTAGVNFGFGLYDRATVTRLIADNPQILPEWRIDEPKEYVWNQRLVNNCVTQGIIQGESLSDIATRIATATSNQNRNLALTHARTAMTGAQNAGRVQRLQDAKKMGLKVVKEWLATLDAHTRDSHRDMDGEQRPVGDQWHPMKFSNGCRYPGDPQGPAHEVYNCRCTLTGDLADFPDAYKRYDNIDGKPVEAMSYREWEAARREEAQRHEEVIRYADFGGSREVHNILAKYENYDDFLDHCTTEEFEIVDSAFGGGDTATDIRRAMGKIEEERASIVAETVEDEYSKYGGKEVYDILSRYRSFDDFENFSSIEEVEEVLSKLYETMGDDIDVRDEITRIMELIREEHPPVAPVIDYDKYGGREVYDTLSKYRSYEDFMMGSSIEEYERIMRNFSDPADVVSRIAEIQASIGRSTPILPADMPYVNDVNDIWRKDSRKVRYHDDAIEYVRRYYGAETDEQAEEMLNASIQRLVNNSDLGSRIDAENLISVLNDGRFMNQFETGTSHGALALGARTNCELEVFGVPVDTSGANRPVYGMLFPKVDNWDNGWEDVDSSIREFYRNGPGDHYGNCTVIFRRENIINNTTLTLGDSLDNQYATSGIRVSDPVFTCGRGGIAGPLLSPDLTDNTEFVETMSWTTGYCEIQLHGVQSHSINNIERVIVDRHARGADELIRMLDERGIPYTYM